MAQTPIPPRSGADPMEAARNADKNLQPIDEWATGEAKSRIAKFEEQIEKMEENKRLLENNIEILNRTKRAEEARLRVLTEDNTRHAIAPASTAEQT